MLFSFKLEENDKNKIINEKNFFTKNFQNTRNDSKIFLSQKLHQTDINKSLQTSQKILLDIDRFLLDFLQEKIFFPFFSQSR